MSGAENSGAPSAHYADREDWAALTGFPGQPSTASAMYRMRLNGPAPLSLLSSPKAGRPPNPRRGEHIIQGQWKFGGSIVRTPEGCAPWGPPFPTLHFADRIHRFHWMGDVIAAGSQGESRARSLLISWTDHFGKWDAFAWRIDVTADRVINWLSAAPHVIDPLEEAPRDLLLECLARQVRHLFMTIDERTTLDGAFRRAVALTLAGASMPEGDKYLETGLDLLEREIERQILADGGHVSRCPSRLADFLLDLHVAEDLLLRMSRTAPAFLTRVQNRMQNMLKFFAVRDGGLVVANAGSDALDGVAKAALAPFGEGGGKFAFAQLTGFHRVEADQTTLYMDTGSAPSTDLSENAASGCLSISVNDGPDRIITNVGAHSDSEPAWRMAARRTAAHSTLQVSDKELAEFARDPVSGLTRLRGPEGVSARRLEEGDDFLLEAQHGGWRQRYGLIHRRRIYVSKSGREIRGEDSLYRPLNETAPPHDGPIPFTIRFQLHSDVEAARKDSDREVYLGLPHRQRIWRFFSESSVDIAESVYAAHAPRSAAPQLSIYGHADPSGDGAKAPNRIRWALVRVEP